jgi:hypothetical protein
MKRGFRPAIEKALPGAKKKRIPSPLFLFLNQ